MNNRLSIVVVYFDIPMQFQRTLYTLSPAFQLGIDPADYEVLVIDNGSSQPPDVSEARALGMNVEVLRVDDATPSPSRAINLGLNASLGRSVGVFIDGARLASPGLLSQALAALRVSDRAVVGSRGRYLGPSYQRESMREGYNEQAESALLGSIDWRSNGYRLFDISVFDESSGECWTDPISESNSLFMARALWQELDGYSTAFEAPGGGYVNLDTWFRACELPDVTPVVLLGEATFHQFHGGVATNGPEESLALMHEEYVRLRGRAYAPPDRPLSVWGRPVPDRGASGTAREGLIPDVGRSLTALAAECEALEGSLSWRLSAPLRGIVDLLRPARRPGPPPADMTEAARVRYLKARIGAIRQSRSWRLTRPLRALSARPDHQQRY